MAQRWQEWLLVAAMLLLLTFFVAHQAAGTGFFTEGFGTLEMISLYGPILLTLLAPLYRFLTGERNPARLFEIAANLALMFGSLQLLRVFPFDFTHLADVLPSAFQTVLAWMSDGFGKVILLIQVVIGAVSAIATAVKYVAMR